MEILQLKAQMLRKMNSYLKIFLDSKIINHSFKLYKKLKFQEAFKTTLISFQLLQVPTEEIVLIPVKVGFWFQQFHNKLRMRKIRSFLFHKSMHFCKKNIFQVHQRQTIFTIKILLQSLSVSSSLRWRNRELLRKTFWITRNQLRTSYRKSKRAKTRIQASRLLMLR